jgi:hypothetical protein
LFYSL